MAITIISSPAAEVNPVYNPFFYEVSSTNTGQPNFQYIFQIFQGATPVGTPIATINLLPRPSTGYALLNPARILESRVSYGLGYQNITNLTQQFVNIQEYNIDYGESYGPLSAGTAIYSGLNSSVGFVMNAVVQYDQLPNWENMYDGLTTIPNAMFLTNQPRSGVYVREATDRGCVSFFDSEWDGGDRTYSWRVKVYPNSGGTHTYDFTATTLADDIYYVPTGPWNINNAGMGNIIDINNDSHYTVDITSRHTIFFVPTAYTETLTYLIDHSCNKYVPQRVMWMNPYGGWDFFNFNLVSKETLNVSRNTYKQTLPYNYTIGARQTTVIEIDGTYNYELNSDWINDSTSTWLQEMVISPEIYLLDTLGNAYPVQMVEDSYYIQKSINDKLYNVSFNFTSSYEINAARN